MHCWLRDSPPAIDSLTSNLQHPLSSLVKGERRRRGPALTVRTFQHPARPAEDKEDRPARFSPTCRPSRSNNLSLPSPPTRTSSARTTSGVSESRDDVVKEPRGTGYLGFTRSQNWTQSGSTGQKERRILRRCWRTCFSFGIRPAGSAGLLLSEEITR